MYKLNNKNGSSLVVTIILVFIASFSSIAMINYFYNMRHFTERTIAMERAYITAESGLYQAINYLEYPENINKMQNKVIDNFTINDGKDWEPLLENGLFFIDYLVDLNINAINMNNAEVIELKIIDSRKTPISGFPISSDEAEYSIWSTARARVGTTDKVINKTAVMDISFIEKSSLSIPAGIVIAGKNSSITGNFNINWGEVWSMGNIKLNKNFKNSDKWTIYRSARGNILDNNGREIADDTIWDISSVINSLDYIKLDEEGNQRGILYQYEDYLNPDKDSKILSEKINNVVNNFIGENYFFWRNIAISRGTYFLLGKGKNSQVKNSRGNLLYYNDRTNTISTYNKEGYSIMNAEKAMLYYRSLSNAYIAFFDYDNVGIPPEKNEDFNFDFEELQFSGQIDSPSKGLLYFCSDIKITGISAKTSGYIESPDGEQVNVNSFFHDGIIFVYGDYDGMANPSIYGSLIINGSLKGSGTPNIYYNNKLKDKDPYNLTNSFVRIISTFIR